MFRTRAASVIIILSSFALPLAVSAASTCTLTAFVYNSSGIASSVAPGTKLTLWVAGPARTRAAVVDQGVGTLSLLAFSTSVYGFAYPTISQTTTYTATLTTSEGPVSCSATVNVQGSTGSQSCVFNGQTVPSGSSIVAYDATSVTNPDTCAAHSDTRTCTNGVLSGSNQYATCVTMGGSIAAAPSITTAMSATASRTYKAHSASLAIDGDPATSWNAGKYAPQWIEVDLGGVRRVSGMDLTVLQSPVGATEHRIYAGTTTNPSNLVATLAGTTRTGDVLHQLFSSPIAARFIRILTVKSPSWVAWREVAFRFSSPPGTPTAAPAAGAYVGVQSVTLSSTDSSSIRYTTDGTMPSCSSGTLYSAPITVSQTTTIRAVGCGAGGESGSGTFTYTINTHPRDFGFWMVDCGRNDVNGPDTTKTSFTDEVAGHATIAQLCPVGSDPTISQAAKLSEYKQDGMRAVVLINRILFVGSKLRRTATGEFDPAVLNKFIKNNEGYLTPEYIKALELFDEPLWDGTSCNGATSVSYEDMRDGSAALKAALPDIPQYFSESHNCVSELQVPPTVDFVSFHDYANPDPAQDADYMQNLRTLAGKLSSGQKLWVVLDAQWNSGARYATANLLPDDMGDVAKNFWNLSCEPEFSDKVDSVFAYRWPADAPPPNGPLGARDFSAAVRSVYDAMYSEVQNRTCSRLEVAPSSKPSANPGSGSYSGPQNVLLSAANATSIRYTTDGSVPTCSSGSVYAAPIGVDTNTTITAVGCNVKGVSAAATFAYTVTAADRPPVSSLDSIGYAANGKALLSGWAFDPDSSATTLTVNVTKDGAQVATIVANRPAAAVNSTYGITGDHRFYYYLPSGSPVGTYRAYAVDSETGTQHEMNGSPKVVNPGTDCVLDGVTVANDMTRPFYSTQNAVSPATCGTSDQSRLCQNGTLSGDPAYQYASCVNSTTASASDTLSQVASVLQSILSLLGR